MADGLNQARAMRSAEIIAQFRDLQHKIARFRASPSEAEKDGEGYKLLRQCSTEGQAILKAPFSATSEPPSGDLEKEKEQLQQVMLDACSRRFQAQKIFLRGSAAMRWINSRNAILQNGTPNPSNSAALSVVNSTLRSELASITDSKVVSGLLEADQQQGKWVQEDPNLSKMSRFIASKKAKKP